MFMFKLHDARYESIYSACNILHISNLSFLTLGRGALYGINCCPFIFDGDLKCASQNQVERFYTNIKQWILNLNFIYYPFFSQEVSDLCPSTKRSSTNDAMLISTIVFTLIAVLQFSAYLILKFIHWIKWNCNAWNY